MNSSDKKKLKGFVSGIDKDLVNCFQSVFGRSPESTDRFRFSDGPFDIVGIGIELGDGFVQVFAFMKDHEVHPITDFGFEVCYWLPVANKYIEGAE